MGIREPRVESSRVAIPTHYGGAALRMVASGAKNCRPFGSGRPVNWDLMPRYLLLGDGTVYDGRPFGAPDASAVGEVVFNTGMTRRPWKPLDDIVMISEGRVRLDPQTGEPRDEPLFQDRSCTVVEFSIWDRRAELHQGLARWFFNLRHDLRMEW